MRKFIIALIILTTSEGLTSIQTSFSDNVINIIYNIDKDSNISENPALAKMFTPDALNDFIKDFKASNLEKNIQQHNYVSTVFKTSPTIYNSKNRKSYTTFSKINVYLTNTHEQLIIPMEVKITSIFTPNGLKINQFSSKLTGQISLINPEQERLKNCGRQTDSRA